MSKISVGDWVLVWGQVIETDIGVHPEDVLIDLFSHSEQYKAHVKRERVVVPGEIPPFAGKCTALRDTKKGALRRCVRHRGHGGFHQDSKGTEWDNHFVVGHIEE